LFDFSFQVIQDHASLHRNNYIFFALKLYASVTIGYIGIVVDYGRYCLIYAWHGYTKVWCMWISYIFDSDLKGIRWRVWCVIKNTLWDSFIKCWYDNVVLIDPALFISLTFNDRDYIDNFNYSTMNNVCTMFAQESLMHSTMNNVCLVSRHDS